MTDNSKLGVLLIDDDPQDRALARLVLSRDLPEARIFEVTDATDFAEEIRRGRFNLVVTEFQLSWTDGLALLRAVREGRPEAPVLAFTDLRDEEVVVEAMKAGCVDFLFKGSKGFLELPVAVGAAWDRAHNRLLAARSEPWLGTLLDRAEIGVYRSTLDGRLIEATPALLRLLGVTSVKEVLKIDLPRPQLLSEEGKVLLERLGQDRVLRSREAQVRRADGSLVWLNLTEMVLLDVDQEIVIDVLVQDIGQAKQREEEIRWQLEEIERSNKDLSQFAYIASHELQEPLRMVEKFGEILAEDYGKKLGAEGGELLHSMIDGAQRMQRLIDDLLALSRIDTEGVEFEEFDLGQALEQALVNLETVITETGASIDKVALPSVRGDSSQLVQLWQNLLSNAIKFRGEEPPEIEISVDESDQEWVFTLADNGIGIDPKELDNIFVIFRRLHPELPGTGIGLTICKRIVERHGGRLWAESEPGPGARLRFSLPKPARSVIELGEPSKSSESPGERVG